MPTEQGTINSTKIEEQEGEGNINKYLLTVIFYFFLVTFL